MDAFPEERVRPPISRVLLAFTILFVVYQSSEWLQTVFAPGSALGPALMFAAVLLPWPLGRWLGFRGYDAFGLDLKPDSARLVVALTIVALLAFLASRALGAELGVYSAAAPQAVSWPTLAILTAALVTFVPSLAEDILTRGFLLTTVPFRLGPVSYVAGTALLYTANHIWRLDWGISEQIRLFCLGLAYGAAAYRWRTLWGAVAVHWGWNFSNVVADKFMFADVVQVNEARYLSAAVHLLMLAIILFLPISQTPITARYRGAGSR